MGLLAKSGSRSGVTAVVLAAILALLATEASALTIPAEERGWVSKQGSTYASNGASATNNYIAGLGSAPESDYRDWFRFDLSGVSDAITSAVFRINTASYISADPSETLDLYSATNPDLGSVVNAAVWDDLGSGSLYATQVLTAANANSVIDIPLSAAAIADLNASLGGTFTMGGAVVTPFGHVFSGSAGTQYVTELVLTTVPEPGTAALVAVGLLGMAFRRRG